MWTSALPSSSSPTTVTSDTSAPRSRAAAAAFGSENALFDPLLDRTLGLVQLGHQVDKAAARAELHNLVNGYPDDPALTGVVRAGLLNTLPAGQSNDQQRTRSIANSPSGRPSSGVCPR